MDSSAVSPSKCLFNITQLFQESAISQDEKLRLKYLVFLEYPEIFDIFGRLEQSINQDQQDETQASSTNDAKTVQAVKELKELTRRMTMSKIEQLKINFHNGPDEDASIQIEDSMSPDIRRVKVSFNSLIFSNGGNVKITNKIPKLFKQWVVP